MAILQRPATPLTDINIAKTLPANARGPTVNDDVTAGFRDAGMLSHITPVNKGTGFTTASTTLTAAPAGGVTATVTPVISGGGLLCYTITNPGAGYTADPSATTTGDGSGQNAQCTLSLGDLWVQTTPSKNVWQLADATAGAASWLPYFGTSPTPADSVALAAQSLYGTILLKSAYVANKCFDVTRKSDNTSLTVGFIGTEVDAGAADLFCAGTTGRITKLYDQSGNGNDMTAPAATAPFWTGNRVNGRRCISFASVNSNIQIGGATIAAGGTGYVAGDVGKTVTVVGGTAAPTGTITIATVGAGAVTGVTIANPGAYSVFPTSPASVTGGGTTGSGLTLTLTELCCFMTASPSSYTNGSATMFAAVQARTSGMTNALGNFGSSWNMYLSNGTFATPGIGHQTSGFSLPCPTTPEIVSFNGQGFILKAQVGNVAAQYNGGTGTSVSTMVLGANNADGSTGPAVYDGLAWMTYSSNPTAAQMTAIRASLSLRLDIAPQILTRDIWVVDGDSITNGYNTAPLGRTYPRLALPLLARPMRQHNIAIYGITLAAQQSAFAAHFLPIYDANARNFIVSCAEGTNDIGASTSGAAVFALMTTYVGQLKALGPNVRVIVCTLLPRSGMDSTRQAELLNYNTALRAGWRTIGADAFVDFANDPIMGSATAAANTALFSDGLHPTDVGYAYMARLIAPAVNQVII